MTNASLNTIFTMLDRAMTYPFDSKQFSASYPPYNHYLTTGDTDDDELNVIEMAVTGFDPEDISVTVDDDARTLTIEGKTNTESTDFEYVVRNLGQRSFKRVWTLKAGIEVRYAEIKNGVLTVALGDSPDRKESIRQIEIHSS